MPQPSCSVLPGRVCEGAVSDPTVCHFCGLHLRPCFPLAGPKTERDKLAAAPPISIRYSRDLGVLQLTIFVVALGYAGKPQGGVGVGGHPGRSALG